MKIPVVFLSCVLTAMLWSGLCRAATVQWTYPGTNSIFQVVADGRGGCAFARIVPPLEGQLIWLDKEGNLLYQSGLSNVQAGAVVACTDKQLVFADRRPEPVMFVVDTSGAATPVPAPPNSVNRMPGMFAFGYRVLYDSKGFFAVNTNGASTEVTLVRYSNK